MDVQKLSKSERTRLQILEAAALLLSKKPDATLAEIADQAGIGRATLHRHFAHRDDLMRQLALSSLDGINAACRPVMEQAETALQALEEIINSLVPMGDQYRFLASSSLIYTDPEIQERYNRHLIRLSELFEQLKEENVIDTQVPTAWVVAVIDSLIYAAWINADDGYLARRDAPALALRTILKGLG